MPDTLARQLPDVAEGPWLHRLPPASRFILQGGAAARSAAALVWGVEFSDAPCRAVVHGERATLWLGPDEHLLLDRTGTAGAAVERALGQTLSATPHSLVDVSHRQFALEVSGSRAAAILNGACPLDLDPERFPVGMCTRTVLGKAEIVLWRPRADAFHLEVWRSFAGYVSGLLGEIADQLDPREPAGR